MDVLSEMAKEMFVHRVSHWKAEVRNTLHDFEKLGWHPLGSDKLTRLYRDLYLKLDEIKYNLLSEVVTKKETDDV